MCVCVCVCVCVYVYIYIYIGKVYSEQCDIYSVGVVFLQMVAGFKTLMQRVDAL